MITHEALSAKRASQAYMKVSSSCCKPHGPVKGASSYCSGKNLFYMEAQLARNGNMIYSAAIQRIHNTRTNFSVAASETFLSCGALPSGLAILLQLLRFII